MKQLSCVIKRPEMMFIFLLYFFKFNLLIWIFTDIKILKLIGDINEPAFCQKIVDDTVNKFKKINVLVKYSNYNLK